MPKITLSHSDGSEQKFSLQGKFFKVGRAPDNDIVLPDGASSNYHAVLKVTESGDFSVTDLGSTNHTKVNGKRVSTAQLHDGDRILFGDTLALYASEIRDEDDADEGRPRRKPLPERPSPPTESRTASAPAAVTGRLRDEGGSGASGGGCLGLLLVLVLPAAGAFALGSLLVR